MSIVTTFDRWSVSHKLSKNLLQLEMVLTTAMFAIPVINQFWNDIGMDQNQIGISQTVFTLALLVPNIQTGWLADKVSRKLCNATGDIIVAIGYVCYAFAGNFWHVIGVEIVIGLGLSLSGGVDLALLGAYCQRLGKADAYDEELSRVSFLKPIVEMIGVIIGGIIGSHQPRLALLLTALPFVVGAILSLLMAEDGGKPEPHVKLVDVIRASLHTDRVLRWHIFAYALAREVTHPLIWILTPLLIIAGVPVAWVGAGWAVNLLLASAGTWLMKEYGTRLPEWQRFAVPMLLACASITVLAVQVSAWTIWVYGCLGLVRGWVSVTAPASVMRHSSSEVRTTVSSIASTVSGVLYAVTVWLINWAGTGSMQYSLIAAVGIFAPLVLVTGYKLYKCEVVQEM